MSFTQSQLLLPRIADFLKKNDKDEIRFHLTWQVPFDNQKSKVLYLPKRQIKPFDLRLEMVSNGKEIWLEQDRQMPIAAKDKDRLKTETVRKKYKRRLEPKEFPKLYKLLPSYFERVCKQAKIV